MIYFTGDTHCSFERFYNRGLARNYHKLTENDYVIVCGDFGLCWAKSKEFEYNCDFFTRKKFTILWVQGNHENYDMIAEYPVEEWHGGKVRHIVRNKVILLERGQVFNIDGETFFTFGGASSHDIQGGILNRDDLDFATNRRKAIESGLPFRINHESWWKEELPSATEMQEGLYNLIKCNYKVDYVITHCCSTSMQRILEGYLERTLVPDTLTDYFQDLEEKLEYKHWFFGHYHLDIDIDDRHTLLYYSIIPLSNYRGN